MPISQISVDGSRGGQQIEEYSRAQRNMVEVYVSALGRYPDPAAMKEQVMKMMGMIIMKMMRVMMMIIMMVPL